MNKIKKISVLLLAFVMVFVMNANVFAAESGHTYETYKIFSGTQAEGSQALADVKWGDGVDEATILDALKADDTIGTALAKCDTAADVATAMKDWTDGSDEAKAFARVAYANKKTGVAYSSTTDLDPGYYLVVDTTDVAGKDDVKNLALLQLTQKGSFDIAQKADKPSLIKKVKDINDSTETALTEWQDSADHDFGDEIPFLLKATLPTKLAEYKTYKLVFHDTGCAGLAVKEDSFVVYVGATELDEDDYTVDVDGNNFTVSIADVKALGGTAGGTVTVEYIATLTTSANIGSAGNPNVAYLEYSNDANYVGDGTNEPTGKTPEDKVIVFTYKAVVNKVDQDKNALKGAGFTLYKYDKDTEKYVSVGSEVKGADLTTFEWKGIDDGQYKLVETTIPNGYNKMADQEFTVTASHDIDSADPKLTDLSGDALTGSVITFTKDVTAGTITSTVENKAGTTLPETGGMGTTVIYLAGGFMVLAAAVLMITRKRMTER